MLLRRSLLIASLALSSAACEESTAGANLESSTGGASETDASSDDGSSNGGSTSDMPGEPVCCGCLCVDAQWSCDEDTCVDADGHAVELRREAGFIQLPQTEAFDTSEGRDCITTSSRLWYSFAPAHDQPENKPLLVFFNGGPGTSTTSGLFAFRTGPQWVDTGEPGMWSVEDNPNDWSSFANLLYIDPPTLGYSYTASCDGPNCSNSCPLTLQLDAAEFLLGTLMFLDRHPQLLGDVHLVGESYGGTRAGIMTKFARSRDGLGADGIAETGFRHAALADALAGRSERIRGGIGIQGSFRPLGQSGHPDHPECPPGSPGDFYACNQPYGDLDRRFAENQEAAVDRAALDRLTGVDTSSIEWLAPDLEEGFTPNGPPAYAGLDDALELTFTHWWLDTLPSSQWFLSDARQDLAVRTDAFPGFFADTMPGRISSASFRDASPFRVLEIVEGDQTHTLVTPIYPDAGHAATLYAPAAMHADVERYLQGL